MIYLDYFTFAEPIKEELFLNYLRRTCYDTFYPFQFFRKRGLGVLILQISRYSTVEMDPANPLANLDKLRKRNMALSKTQSKYVRNTVPENVREKSNGESAFDYFVNKIDRDGIYLLDEPENSLSPMRQIELTKFLEDSVRFFPILLRVFPIKTR